MLSSVSLRSGQFFCLLLQYKFYTKIFLITGYEPRSCRRSFRQITAAYFLRAPVISSFSDPNTACPVPNPTTQYPPLTEKPSFAPSLLSGSLLQLNISGH
jgi:hypothetical protein